MSRLARWRMPAWSVLLALCVSLVAPTGAAAQTAPRPSDSDIEYYHTDAIGSVRMITNDAGLVIAQHDYLPFGTAFGQSQPSAHQPRGFAGKEFDPETGFDYFGGRYLVAGAARFTTVDPVLRVDVASANPQRWYRYSYALNGPLRHSDPDGREVPVVVNGRFYNSGIDGTRVASASDANWTFAKFVGIVLGAAVVAPVINAAAGCVVTPTCNVAAVAAIAATAPGASLPTPGPIGAVPRALAAADLGVQGALAELRGSIALADGAAHVRIDMIRGDLQNPLKIMDNLVTLARERGASTLTIEGTIANPRLLEIFTKRYGATTNGANEIVTIQLR